jgi:hypothetical protein
MGGFRYREQPDWPPLAWLAVCDPAQPEPLVLHGSRVETRPDWFCEAVWDGDFERGDFDASDRVYGSGGRVRERTIRFVSCGTTLDRLHHVRRGELGFVSNSLAALVTVAELELDPTWPHYPKDFMSIKRGIRDCVQRIRAAPEPVELVYYDDLVWAGGVVSRAAKHHEKADVGSHAAYRRFMDETLSRLLANARSEARIHRYEPIVALSSGMDSGASAALAAPFGLREGFTFRSGRYGREDAGQAVARALGIELHELEREAWRDHALAEVPFVLGDARGPDVFYRAAEPFLSGRLLLTGYGGGGLWNPKRHPQGDELTRIDTSGLSLTEYRLWTGTLHLAVPMIGYRQASEIAAVGRQPEMRPWSVGGAYDKPVARRILLEAGVPEAQLARENRAATVLWSGEWTFLSRASREDFAAWLRRNEARLAAAHPGPPVRDLPRGGPRDALGRGLQVLARRSPRAKRPMKATARWLRRSSDPRPVLRYLLPWAMEHGRRRYASASLPPR